MSIYLYKRSLLISTLVSIVLVILTALTGMLFLPGAWYEGLYKPHWTPPNIVFPIMWSTLYLIDMLVGAWVIQKGIKQLLFIWLLQLIFNACWSYLVFGHHQLFLGLLDIVFLWLTILLFLLSVFNKQRVIFILFIPYLLWVSIAMILNLNLWLLN
ncbi:tryptophan-rich sensory protein [Ferrovum sp. PN-J185]|uniref:TspO/MBR family protein n=1 Tax=Ferrovum sp. PN-J185 TaxID=1356306 RepID=UPI000792DABA|nr:TspO/MBR family protein [Ferrovum sp. PN-J185]KXW55323.1 TspO/MBR family protein [Ferrovum sp. PN-J185]MCC6068477.1 tryptophan-rich sensory protein [Ferrovum sp. PN-J185]MDE1892547.1 tryptophan-rich sensory protein [Betaproteobacteria bacterium]MDE2056894.1 tryptophan-rich sensory protein [Betaproteobacteria bacterium]